MTKHILQIGINGLIKENKNQCFSSENVKGTRESNPKRGKIEIFNDTFKLEVRIE